MKYIFSLSILGIFLGCAITHVLYTQAVLNDVEEEGVRNQIMKGVDPDEALAAFRRKTNVRVNYSAIGYKTELFNGAVIGAGVGALLGAVSAVVVDRKKSKKKETESSVAIDAAKK